MKRPARIILGDHTLKKYTLWIGCLVLLCTASVGWAATWTSPDGVISIDVPDDGGLKPTGNLSGPTIGEWETFFGQRRLFVRIWPTPASGRYSQREMEAATLKSIPGGEVTSTTSREINGYLVTDIAFQSKSLKIYGHMAVVIVNKSVYTIGSKAPGEVAKDSVLWPVYQSIRINGPVGPEAIKHSPSYQVGYIGGQVLIYGLIAGLCLLGVRLATRSRKTPPPTPPQMPPSMPPSMPPMS